MSKSEEIKERINYLKGFLTILIGIVVLICGGLVSLHLKDQINEVFWLGVSVIALILLVCLVLMIKIENHLNELGDT